MGVSVNVQVLRPVDLEFLASGEGWSELRTGEWTPSHPQHPVGIVLTCLHDHESQLHRTLAGVVVSCCILTRINPEGCSLDEWG